MSLTSTVAGTAVVNIALNDRYLKAGLQEARNRMEKFSASVTAMTSGLGTLGAFSGRFAGGD